LNFSYLKGLKMIADPFELEIILKIVLAIVLSSLVGFEREMHEKPAGLRTHLLVCTGALLFTVSSLTFVNDPARIAAGIVTGVGFLGAGAIFKFKDHVEGLTTAADLWVLASIGILIGLNLYFTAFSATIILLAVLTLGGKLKLFLKKHGTEKN
jgi:putative Mg2+ transporter-C (MgtC) family protein